MSSDTRFKECYDELSSLWNNYPIVEDYRKTLMGEKGYESWIWNVFLKRSTELYAALYK